MAGAKEKIKAAGSELLDSTQMKLASKVFRVNGKKYKAKKLLAEGAFGGQKSEPFAVRGAGEPPSPLLEPSCRVCHLNCLLIASNIRFSIVFTLNLGGFGYVYLVEDELTGQPRALKHMIMQTREAREAALREIDLHVRRSFFYLAKCSILPSEGY